MRIIIIALLIFLGCQPKLKEPISVLDFKEFSKEEINFMTLDSSEVAILVSTYLDHEFSFFYQELQDAFPKSYIDHLDLPRHGKKRGQEYLEQLN